MCRVLNRGLLVLVLVASGLSVARAEKDDENPHVWKPQTKSVAVFKNGWGFFMRQGNTSLRDGWCLAEQVPPAAFDARDLCPR